ncbi:hypothetical protein IWQ62_000571 [Dispira parvispora]|uniref:Mitochondrial import inner membrane translocase subunit TIM50 n=1 Tax=Dispira parvispora TaxID=1520584 RepID=A0A9W8AU71_9FUNG|nr:hypothetical protein IWQ62_000571 [Dispira parvispora]
MWQMCGSWISFPLPWASPFSQPNTLFLRRTLTSIPKPPKGPRTRVPVLCILDLNGTLVHRDKTRRKNYTRPHVKIFLRDLFQRFHVMVWSSAMRHNVSTMVHTTFGKRRNRIEAVWDRTYCSEQSTKRGDYDTVKDLQRLWDIWDNKNLPTDDAEDATHLYVNDPEGRRHRFSHVWTPENTILVDDSLDKMAWQRANGLLLSSFDDPRVKDLELARLRRYFRTLYHTWRFQGPMDVRSYLAEHPWESYRTTDVGDETEENLPE